MVKDRNNYYYTEILKSLKENYGDIKGGTTYKATPPSFPYMHYKQLNSPTKLSTLSGTEDGISLAVEINLYSKKSLNDCREMAFITRQFLICQGFRIDYFEPVDNVNDATIHRFTIRASKLEV